MSEPWTEFKDHDYRAFLDVIENGIGGTDGGMTSREWHATGNAERLRIGINGKLLTPDQFDAMTTRRDGESIRDHAHRIARTLGVGCVTSS